MNGWRRTKEKIKAKSEIFIFSPERQFEPKRKIMKKPKSEKPETFIKKSSAPRKRKKKQPGKKVEELFGVHIISEADIENHFGTPEQKPDGEPENKKPK